MRTGFPLFSDHQRSFVVVYIPLHVSLYKLNLYEIVCDDVFMQHVNLGEYMFVGTKSSEFLQFGISISVQKYLLIVVIDEIRKEKRSPLKLTHVIISARTRGCKGNRD